MIVGNFIAACQKIAQATWLRVAALNIPAAIEPLLLGLDAGEVDVK